MARAIKITSVSGALTVAITGPNGGTPTVYADSSFANTTSMPATVADGATTTFWLKGPGAYTLSVKTAAGIEIAADNNTTRTVDLETAGTTAALNYDARFTHQLAGDTGRGSDTTDVSATYASRTALKRYVDPLGALRRPHGTAVPSYTVSAANAATTISNPSTVAVNDTTRTRLTGAPLLGLASGAYYGSGVTGSTVDYPATAFETMLYGRYVDFILDADRAFRIFVDGIPLSDVAQLTPTPAGDYRLIIDCGSVGAHHVKVIQNGLTKGWTYDATNGSIYAPATAPLVTDYYLGDSWCQGYGANGTNASAYAPAGLGAYCSEVLGSVPIVGGENGTGYTNNSGGGSGQKAYPARVASEVVPLAPDRVIVVGSVNDTGASASAVQTAAAATFSALASGLPNADVFVFGVQYVPANVGNATYNAIDDAIKAAANAAPNVKLFTSMRSWDIPAAFVTGDGVHLVNNGYKYVGIRMGQVIEAATQSSALV